MGGRGLDGAASGGALAVPLHLAVRATGTRAPRLNDRQPESEWNLASQDAIFDA